ncbi:MAG TPA: hypothetical protein VL285_21365 [Bryobacteraceae bacterium]|nr:hypothetical protein [Bryobacteraceae bacterium]
MDLALASPATGPVARVWFSADGGRLYALTASGRTFESADLETWSPSANPPQPPGPPAAGSGLSPVPGARLYPQDSRRAYALAAHLYRSDDAGRSWTNLTAFGDASVIGAGQRDLAVSPRDADLLIVANDYGVWRSADGGLSWSGLNQFLPNLTVRRIVATPQGLAGTRVLAEGAGLLEFQPGGDNDWRPMTDEQLSQQLLREATQRRAASEQLGAEITALGGLGEIRYAGSSDGRIWISTDSAQTWRGPRPASGVPVENFYVDAQQPRIALAVLGGKGAAHVLRTINTGVSWDDLTANLPDSAVHAVAVDRPSGTAYVATDGGLFFASIDLDRSSPATGWTLISGSLPAAIVTDVKLDPGGNQLYAALEGYGVFATGAPHRLQQLRLVNAADFSTRPAAPGSLMSVLGARITSASAGDLRFPVLDASETESQIQVPFEAAAAASLSLALESAGRRFTFGVPVQNVSPAIFVDRNGSPMLLDSDSGLMFDARNTARSGSRIQILTTGLGKVQPDWPTGMAAPILQPPAVRATMTAFLDRAPVEVLSATLAPGYVGLYLVEIRLPSIVNAGPAELYLAADGQESNRVRIQLEP